MDEEGGVGAGERSPLLGGGAAHAWHDEARETTSRRKGSGGIRGWLDHSLTWRTVRYARPDYKYFVPAVIMLFLESSAAMILIKYVEDMVDIASGTLKYRERDAQENEIRRLLRDMLLLVAGQSAAMFLKTLFVRMGSARLVQRLRAAIHRSILSHIAFEYIDRFSANELVSYLGQVDAMETMVNDRAEMLQNCVGVAMGLGFFFWVNADLGPILVATAGFSVFITFPYNAIVRWNTGRLMRREAALADYAQSSILRVRQVRNLATEDLETRNFARLCREIYLVDRLSAKAAATYDFLISMASGSGFAVAMWLASRDVIERDLSRGKLLAFFMYADIVFENLQALFERMEAYSASTSAARLLFDLIGTKFTADDDVAAKAALRASRDSSAAPGVHSARGSMRTDSSTHGDRSDAAHADSLLRFRDVDCRHPRKWGKDGVRGFSLDVARGEVVYVYGPADLGVSCILDLACGFYSPDRGVVELLGGGNVRVPASPLQRRGSQSKSPGEVDGPVSVAWLSADDDVFPGSVRENIAAGTEGASSLEAVQDAAARAGIHDAIMRLPHGYDTRVTSHFRAAAGDAAPALRGARKPPSNVKPIVLAGHVARRIAVARAFLRQPRLVLADAAFLTCDQDDAEGLLMSVATLLGRSPGSATAERPGLLVVGEHIDESVARAADRIVVLGSDGRICEAGTHAELVARGAVYARLLALRQAQGAWLKAA